MQKIINFFSSFEEFNEKKIFWTAFWIAVVVMILHILFFHKVERDSAYFYTRMAREFGEGRYQYAFWPTIPPLLSILAGCFVKIGFTAFAAVKTVSGIAFIVGLFPFRSLMRRITNDKLAAWACIVYVTSSYLIRYTVYGYPFALKMFFMILSAYYVVKFAETIKIRYASYLGLSLGLLALSRGEGIGLAPFYGLWFIFLPIYFCIKNKEKLVFVIKKQVWGTLAIVLFFIVVCWPQMLSVYKSTGIPLTEVRTAQIFKSKVDEIFVTKKHKDMEIRQKKDLKTGAGELKKRMKEKAYDRLPSLKRSLLESIKGMYGILIIFAFLGLIKKILNKDIVIFDVFFLSIILYNAAMFFLVGVTRRYTAVTQPFEFGWVALGGYYIYSWDKWKIMPEYLRKYWKAITGLAATVVLIVMLINGFNRFNECVFEGNEYYTVGNWIKDNKELFPSKKFIKFSASEKYNGYHTNRLPVVCSINGEYAYWSEGDAYNISPDFFYSYSNLVSMMRVHNATVFVYDGKMQKCTVEFEKKYKKDFVKVKEFPKWDITVFRLNLKE